jgi:hypothetical protein
MDRGMNDVNSRVVQDQHYSQNLPRALTLDDVPWIANFA